MNFDSNALEEVRERYLGAQEKTMKLDPKIVEAAMLPITNWKQREVRARRVLKAASENVPDGVIDEVLTVYALHDDHLAVNAMRAALSAGLAKWAEGE
jgi:hypothetical protein